MGKKVTTESFIKKAIEIHGAKYNYDKVCYENAHKKVCIICPEHGEFWQTPNAQLRGKGCPKCGNINRGKAKRSHTNDFIEKAILVHGDKYDYSKVEYINNHTKVCIICPEHGEFWMIPSNHLRGQGCVKCVRYVSDTSSFIEKAKELHGNECDYSKVKYVDSRTKVCIICPIHGEFWQTPNNHLNGKGCPKCKGRHISEKKYRTNDYFITKANEVHGYKYDYSKAGVIRSEGKSTIICPEHGEFQQTFGNHLMGNGCPKCNDSHLERNVSMMLDKNNIKYETQKKFKWLKNGITKMPLTLDFYLPDFNIAIECQGGQHFMVVNRFGGEKSFQTLVERDLMKLRLCEENGIKLIHYVDKTVRNFKKWDLYSTTYGVDNLLKEIKKG